MISLFGPSFCDTKWAGLKKKFSIHPLWRSVGLGEEGLGRDPSPERAVAAQLRLRTALQQNTLRVAIPLNFPEEPEMQIFM